MPFTFPFPFTNTGDVEPGKIQADFEAVRDYFDLVVLLTGDQTITGDITIVGNPFIVRSAESTTEIRIDNTATDGDPYLSWALSNTRQFSLGVNDGAGDVLQLGTTAIDTGTMWQATAAGEITQPLQPSFLVVDGTGAANVTGDGTTYLELWPTEIYDQGGDFASDTFTAPVTGRYLLTVSLEYTGTNSSHALRQVTLSTSNRNYNNVSAYSLAEDARTITFSVIADMDANDTAVVTIRVTGSTKTVTIPGAAAQNFFSGSLIN
jgi:hypothetical protein